MLATGRSNQAIARELVVSLDTVKKHVGHVLGKLGAANELVVSLDTVKKHVGHVLGKLGAANRTEAVARARELSLIP